MQHLVKQAQEFLYLSSDRETHILDVGSQDVSAISDMTQKERREGSITLYQDALISGSYRKLFENNPLWYYEGLDVVPGRNVNIVAPTIPWPISDNFYDLVVSGQTLEHTQAPWLWIKEIERVCKPGGLIIIIAPWKWDMHKYPVDCWRILPDGMTYLLGTWCNCGILLIGNSDIDILHGDCYGVARKR